MISREVFFINLKSNADLYSSLQPDLSGAHFFWVGIKRWQKNSGNGRRIKLPK